MTNPTDIKTAHITPKLPVPNRTHKNYQPRLGHMKPLTNRVPGTYEYLVSSCDL